MKMILVTVIYIQFNPNCILKLRLSILVFEFILLDARPRVGRGEIEEKKQNETEETGRFFGIFDAMTDLFADAENETVSKKPVVNKLNETEQDSSNRTKEDERNENKKDMVIKSDEGFPNKTEEDSGFFSFLNPLRNFFTGEDEDDLKSKKSQEEETEKVEETVGGGNKSFQESFEAVDFSVNKRDNRLKDAKDDEGDVFNKTEEDSSNKTEENSGFFSFLKPITNFFTGEDEDDRKTKISQNEEKEKVKETVGGVDKKDKNLIDPEDDENGKLENISKEEAINKVKVTLVKDSIDNVKNSTNITSNQKNIENRSQIEDEKAKKIVDNLLPTLKEMKEAIKSGYIIPQTVFARWGIDMLAAAGRYLQKDVA